MRVNPVVRIHNEFGVTFCECVKVRYPTFCLGYLICELQEDGVF